MKEIHDIRLAIYEEMKDLSLHEKLMRTKERADREWKEIMENRGLPGWWQKRRRSMVRRIEMSRRIVSLRIAFVLFVVVASGVLVVLMSEEEGTKRRKVVGGLG